ncbi:MAG: ribonuclease P protein component [Proteobacteria bacterium]|nr:ribonuclease P protein component [Cystobacterineae bacterium]MCL2314472.1 ribonuclease P protein component [Pseudomonadota bacterium]
MRKRQQFLHTQANGRKWRSGCLLGLTTPNTMGFCRLGLTVTKKVGNAVVRNKIRRQLRELFRKTPKAKALPVDLVIVAFADASKKPPPREALAEDFSRLVAKIRVSA